MDVDGDIIYLWKGSAPYRPLRTDDAVKVVLRKQGTYRLDVCYKFTFTGQDEQRSILELNESFAFKVGPGEPSSKDKPGDGASDVAGASAGGRQPSAEGREAQAGGKEQSDGAEREPDK